MLRYIFHSRRQVGRTSNTRRSVVDVVAVNRVGEVMGPMMANMVAGVMDGLHSGPERYVVELVVRCAL